MIFANDVLQVLRTQRACAPGILWAESRSLVNRKQAWARLANETDVRWLPAIPSFQLDTVQRFAVLQHKAGVQLACQLCRNTPIGVGHTSEELISSNANAQLAAVEEAAGLPPDPLPRRRPTFNRGAQRITPTHHAAFAVWDAVHYTEAYARQEQLAALQKVSFYAAAAAGRLAKGQPGPFLDAVRSHVRQIFEAFADQFTE